MHKFLLWAILLTFPMGASAQSEPIFLNAQRFNPVMGQGGMVVSENALATKVGTAVLRRGGNAVDAAVAVGFALAVTYPQAGNLGGGGFMMVHHQGKTSAIDYREVAPMALKAAHFLGKNGEVDREKSQHSTKATGVPGTVAGLLYALDHYGTLNREDVMAPALALAKDGFKVSYGLHQSLIKATNRLSRSGAAKNVFFTPQGLPLPVGALLKQPNLYQTLARIAKTGAHAFYQGEIAKKLVADSQKTGGVLTLADLQNYAVIEREPLWGHHKSYRLAAMPPPSSGGVHLLQMLNMLEGDNLQALGHNSAAYVHILAETMRRAYADRSEYLGDPGFVDVPTEWLTSKTYALERRKEIDLHQATPSAQVNPGQMPPPESPETTHFSVLDQWGNGVSTTTTLNFSYGNGHMPEGLGFLMNNELDDFALQPGVPNAYGLMGGAANKLEGGKRPLSSMVPFFMFKEGELILAAGSPGGSRIITAVLQVVLNLVHFDFNIATAISVPRLHHQWLPDVLQVEQGIGADTRTLLKAMGHAVKEVRPLGSVQAAVRQSDGHFSGFSDLRRQGKALAVE